MRTVYKARIVPDTAPDGLTTKVIKVEDLGVPIEVALGQWGAVTEEQLDAIYDEHGAYWRKANGEGRDEY